MKLKLFGALIGAFMLAAAAPAGAATVTGTSIVNNIGNITPMPNLAPIPFSPASLSDGINGAAYVMGKHYFDYVFSFTLLDDGKVTITGDATAGTNVLNFHTALFSSDPSGTNLLVGASPNKNIFLNNTTGLISEDITKGDPTNIGPLILDPGTYYIRMFGVIAGVSANSKLTSISGTITATPIPAGLPLLMTSLGVMGFMVWRRKSAAPTAAL